MSPCRRDCHRHRDRWQPRHRHRHRPRPRRRRTCRSTPCPLPRLPPTPRPVARADGPEIDADRGHKSATNHCPATTNWRWLSPAELGSNPPATLWPRCPPTCRSTAVPGPPRPVVPCWLSAASVSPGQRGDPSELPPPAGPPARDPVSFPRSGCKPTLPHEVGPRCSDAWSRLWSPKGDSVPNLTVGRQDGLRIAVSRAESPNEADRDRPLPLKLRSLLDSENRFSAYVPNWIQLAQCPSVSRGPAAARPGRFPGCLWWRRS